MPGVSPRGEYFSGQGCCLGSLSGTGVLKVTISGLLFWPSNLLYTQESAQTTFASDCDFNRWSEISANCSLFEVRLSNNCSLCYETVHSYAPCFMFTGVGNHAVSTGINFSVILRVTSYLSLPESLSCDRSVSQI